MTDKTSKTEPMTFRDEEGRVHVTADMKPADNRRVDKEQRRPAIMSPLRNPD